MIRVTIVTHSHLWMLGCLASMNATAPEVHVKSFRDKLENVVVTSSVALAMLLLLGHVARAKLLWLRALHLPSSLIGGLIGWVIFAFVDIFGGGATELVDDWYSAGWQKRKNCPLFMKMMISLLSTNHQSFYRFLEKK